MPRSFEFRLAIVGFLIGAMVALQSLLASSENSDHGQFPSAKGIERYAAAPAAAAVSSSSIQPVYNPPSSARVAQFELLGLDQPERALQVVQAIPDFANRVNSVQWLLDAPQREASYDYQLPPEEKRKRMLFVESQLYKILPALMEKVLADTTQLKTIASVRDIELGDRLVDSLLRIAVLYQKRQERDSADTAAKAAGEESLRLARLTPPDLASQRSGGATPFQDLAGKGESRGNPRWLAMLWPLLSSAFCFSFAQASRPVLEAVGRAVVGRAVADKLNNTDVAKALGLPEHEREAAGTKGNLP